MDLRKFLVLMQKEQSIVEDPNPSPKQFDWAMGYGICDDCNMSDPLLLIYKGFANQIDKAAARNRWYIENSGHLTPPVVGQIYAAPFFRDGYRCGFYGMKSFLCGSSKY